jgi:histone deacetylase 1/2
MISAIAAKENRIVKTADVPVAYLNADNSDLGITMILDKVVTSAFTRLKPEFVGYTRRDGTMLVKLNRALYGCIESARLWYNLLRKSLEDLGFQVNPLDQCVFNLPSKSHQCTVLIYVDDLMITCCDEGIINSTISSLSKRFDSELKVTSGLIHSYLGMEFNFSEKGKVKINMSGYTNDLLNFAGVQGVISSPAPDHLFQVSDSAEPLDLARKEKFHTLVAKSLYLAKRVRPDILLPISFLSSRTLSPDVDDWKKLERMLRYLNGTTELGIILEASDPTKIEGFIDASYGVHSDFKSHSGMVITLGRGPIDVKSSKQKLNTKSSSEAELVACSDMTSRVMWAKNFMDAQNSQFYSSNLSPLTHSNPQNSRNSQPLQITRPAIVYQDNQSAIALETKGAVASDRTRHVSIRYFWMKDKVDSGDIEIVYKPTEEMIADILTKPIHGEQFKRLRNLLLNWNF